MLGAAILYVLCFLGAIMQLFVTYDCPVRSARVLDNRRAFKVLIEAAQMLSIALRMNGNTNPILYKMINPNHPICVWVRKTRPNYDWTVAHYEALCQVYRERTGKIHATEQRLPPFIFSTYSHYIPKGELTPFANCARNRHYAVNFTHVRPTTRAYRKYLMARWEIECYNGYHPYCSLPIYSKE